MLLTMLKSKIHMCRLTGADPDYEGSVGISGNLLAASGILPYEQVLVANAENGARLVTYAIPLPGEGQVVLNGPAAYYGKKGDRIVIMAFALVTPEEARTLHPTVVKPGPDNSV